MWPMSLSPVTLVLFLSLGQTKEMIMLRFSTLLMADTVLISLWILASFLINLKLTKNSSECITLKKQCH